MTGGSLICEREGIVGGDEGPVGGVAQVICRGVKVVGVHGEEGLEKDGEVRGEVKEKSSNSERNAHHGWYEDEDDKRVNGLEPRAMWM